MTVKTKTELVASIEADLANNNSANISAADIRENMKDVAESINGVVASGDHNNAYPFYNNVRASNSEGGGFFIAESGLTFPNSPGATTQYEAYPGANGIDHDSLSNRNSSNDAHTQYLSVDGTRPMEENLPLGGNWINSSGNGYDDRGLKFVHEAYGDNIQVGTSGNFIFSDNSKINTGLSTSKAWLNFDGSGTGTYGTPVVRSHHNIKSIEYLDPGKYKVTIASGVLKDKNFTAIGSSNSRTTAASSEDFARNTVGIAQRVIEANGDASLTFLVLNEAGEYVDAELNDLVVFGYDEGQTSTSPTIIPKS